MRQIFCLFRQKIRLISPMRFARNSVAFRRKRTTVPPGAELRFGRNASVRSTLFSVVSSFFSFRTGFSRATTNHRSFQNPSVFIVYTPFNLPCSSVHLIRKNSVSCHIQDFLLKHRDLSHKNFTFVMSIPIPKAPTGRGWADVYITRRNCTLWF